MESKFDIYCHCDVHNKIKSAIQSLQYAKRHNVCVCAFRICVVFSLRVIIATICLFLR